MTVSPSWRFFNALLAPVVLEPLDLAAWLIAVSVLFRQHDRMAQRRIFLILHDGYMQTLKTPLLLIQVVLNLFLEMFLCSGVAHWLRGLDILLRVNAWQNSLIVPILEWRTGEFFYHRLHSFRNSEEWFDIVDLGGQWVHTAAHLCILILILGCKSSTLFVGLIDGFKKTVTKFLFNVHSLLQWWE